MAFQRLVQPDCPQCGKSAVHVLESKKAQHGQRRRKHCEACGYRFTTYEISSEHYAKYDHFLHMYEQLSKRLGYIPTQDVTSQEDLKCTSCSNNVRDRCSYDFPEYNTTDSFDCNHYEH